MEIKYCFYDKKNSKKHKNSKNMLTSIKIFTISIFIVSLIIILSCFCGIRKPNKSASQSCSKQQINKNNFTKCSKKLSKKKKLKTLSTAISRFPLGEKENNRIFNIKKIVKHLNNTVINPDQEFSFQKIYDKSNTTKNFKLASGVAKKKLNNSIYAGGIKNFKLASGVAKKKLNNSIYAGGICQVCSALYQATKAIPNLVKITAHKKHSIPVFYSGKNQENDAMFSSNFADFKFKNVHKHPIIIKATVKNDLIKIRLCEFKKKLKST